MRILVLSTTDIVKAAHSRPHQIVTHLSAKHKLEVFCANAWWLTRNGKQLYHHTYNQNVNIGFFSKENENPIRQERLAASRFERDSAVASTGYDLILDFDSLIVGRSALRFAKRNRIPFVFDLDDDLPAMIRGSPNVPLPLRALAGAVARKYARRLCRDADRVIVTLPSLGEDFGVSSNKLSVIPNGVDTEMFARKPSHVRGIIGLKNEFVIGYVGVLREWVDFSPVFAALRILKGVKLLIVGDEGALDRNKRLAADARVADNVLFVGAVPYEEVPEYISAMDACIIPFRLSNVTHRAVPLKLFEYIACEKPVFSSALKGVRELAGSRLTYYTDPTSLADGIDKMRKLNDHPELASNRDWVMREYSWPRLCGVFDEVVAGLAK